MSLCTTKDYCCRERAFCQIYSSILRLKPNLSRTCVSLLIEIVVYLMTVDMRSEWSDRVDLISSSLINRRKNSFSLVKSNILRHRSKVSFWK